jgi:lipid II:glycine glycyltransferase (peptidoglycan interpeptide bridge formation enzyme)
VGRHENSIVGMDPMATHCRTKMLWPDKKILFKKQLFDLEVKGQGPTKVITVCDTPPYGYIIDLSGKTKKGMVRTSFAEKKWKRKKSD